MVINNNDENNNVNIQDNVVADTKVGVLRRNFLSKIEEHLTKRGFRHFDLEISPGSEKGDNYCGTISKIKVEIRTEGGESKTINWISKSAMDREPSRKLTQTAILYSREIYMYEQLFPLLSNFQEQKDIVEPFRSYPPYVLSHIEPDQENLIMMDMKSVGYKMKNKVEVLDINHVKLVLKAYAKLHALSYAMKDQRPEEYRKIAQEAADMYFCNQQAEREIVRTYEENYRRQVNACLDPVRDAKVLELLNLFTKKPNAIVTETVAKVNEYSVVVHGDCWVNNMLFKYENRNNPNLPTKVCLLDFQMSRLGSPVFDLSYFIYTCTSQELRNRHYKNLIRYYHYTLCQHLNDLGSDAMNIIPFEALERELQRYSIVGLYLSSVVLRFMLNPKDETPEWSKADDIEGMVEAMTFKSTDDSLYRERTRDIIVDFANRGYFDFLKDC